MHNECIASLMTYTDAKLIKLHEKNDKHTHRSRKRAMLQNILEDQHGSEDRPSNKN